MATPACAPGRVGCIVACNRAGAPIAQPLPVLPVIEHAGLIDASTMGTLHMPIFFFVLWSAGLPGGSGAVFCRSPSGITKRFSSMQTSIIEIVSCF